MKKEIVVYPYENGILETIKKFAKEKNGEIILCVPKDKTFEQKDASILDNRHKLGIKLETDVWERVESASILVIVDNIWNDKLQDEINNIIEKAIRLKIEIYICSNKVGRKFEYMEGFNKYVKCYDQNIEEYHKVPFDYSWRKIEAPILFVTNMYMESDSYEITVNISETLKQMGLKILTIANRYEGQLIGYKCIKDFFELGNLNIESKMLLLNSYVKSIEEESQIDLIIIEIPGGLYPYNNYLRNDCGSYLYMINRALPADYMVLCTMYENYNREYWNIIEEDIQKKFDIRLFSIHISRKMFDVDEITENHKKRFLYLNEKSVDTKVYLESEIPIINGLAKSNIDVICKKILED